MRAFATIAMLLSLCSCHSPEVLPEKHHDGHAAGHADEHGFEHADEHGGEGIELSASQRDNAGVRTEVLVARLLAVQVQASAEVVFDPDRTALVASPVQGRIARVEVVPGARVEKGAVLAVIDSRELGEAKGEYMVARAAFGLAEQNLKREEVLAAQRISSALDLATARAERLQTQAALEAAEETLLALGMSSSAVEALRPDRHAPSQLQLRSPISGVVTRRDAVVGAGVQPLEPLFTVADTSRVWVLVDVLEKDLAAVRSGQQARVRTSAFDDVFEGEVTYLAPVMDEITRTVTARVEVDNPEGALRPGMFAQVEIEVGGEGAAVLAIPTEAIVRRKGKSFAFVEDSPGRFRREELELGPTIGTQRVVLAGLEAGDRVAVEGAFFLQSEVEKGSFEAGHAH
jgi:cobalt-zinc-cadmium efflux system membrane fusion protein